MKGLLKVVGLVGTFILLFASQATAYHISNVDVTISQTAPGTWKYQYILGNEQGSTSEIYDFFLSFDGIPDNVISPGGWDTIPGISFIDWSADFDSEILPGDSLSGFSFEAPYGPGNITFETMDTNWDTYSGITKGPAAPIPEPATFLILISGLTGLFILIKLKYLSLTPCQV